mmetsp:Transcript_16611/g.28511  ORF Transcript_16611/g.28511 Transcript_16611/m.28511 type:complete len:306 (-) Transcript_16611:254-1171(-)
MELNNCAQTFHELVKCVQKAAHSTRAFQQCRRQLVIDLAVLVAGVRGALMLDYCPALALAPLVSLVEEVNSLGHNLAVLTNLGNGEACHLVIDKAAMLAHLSRVLVSGPHCFPVMVGFTPDPVLLSSDEAKACTSQLEQLQHVLHQACSRSAAKQGHEGSTGLSSIVLDLAPFHLPLLPTLNGLLLAYPCVYLVKSRAEAQSAGRCLSMASDLKLVQLVATLPGAIVSLLPTQPVKHGKKGVAVPSAAQHVLAAFTVPGQFLAAPDEVLHCLIKTWGDEASRQAPEGWEICVCTSDVEAGCAISL